MLAFCLFLGASGIVRAQTPGSLDTTFGAGGKVITPIGSSNDGISGVAIQANGKTVAVGYADNGTNSDFALARYNADGTLDTSFGTGGKVITPIGSANDFASAVAIQTDGKIVVAGYAGNGTNLDFAVARYNADGTLDTSFGTGGKVITPIGSSDDFASAVAIQTDGKIVVAGAVETSVFSNDFALVRYNINGTLDTSFGTGGKVITPIGGSDDFASAVAIQTDGKIIVAGASSDGVTDDFALARYNINGTLDTSFGTGGKAITPIGSSDDFASAVAIQTDGKIIVAGDSNNGSNADFALARYNINGTLDTSFGTGGKVITPIGSANDFLYAAAIQPNGKIVAAGSAAGTTDDFAVARYNADGTLDTSFGTGGKVITPIGNANDFASAVAIQADGKIIVAGSANNGTNLDFALARYFGTNPNNPVPSISGLTPNNKLIGSGAFELTVNGSNFVANSVVRFNGQDRATTFVSDTQLKAQILASDIQTSGQFPVTVFNPAPSGGTSNVVNFTVGACSYSLTPTSQTFTNAGGSSSTSVTTQNGCSYTAVSNAPFVSVTGGGSGSGNGTVTFTVAANTGPARTGTITIGGQTFTVTQADGCTYAITPTSGNYSAAGETGSFTVATSNAGCTYTATTNASFITINNGTGTTSGTVTFTVAANTGVARTGTITVDGQTFTVNQASGCTYSLSPTSITIPNAGGSGSFNVITGTGCAYTATSNASFITINNGTGTGNNGTITFTVAANTGTDRTGTITVNGQTFTINQLGNCIYTLSPMSLSIGTNGGAGSFAVTTNPGCLYTATSNDSFITITIGTGTGSGVVVFNVSGSGGAERTGTINVNGQVFTVIQSASCNPTISAVPSSFTAAGGTGTLNVSIGAGCIYSAVSNDPFITITNGSGTGSGTVTFTVAANPGFDRLGTITVYNTTATISQAGECQISLTPSSANFSSSGGQGSFTVTTGTGCTFTALTNDSFINISNGTGTGNGTVTFTVAVNTGSSRIGSIYINGKYFAVYQSANMAGPAFDFDGDGKADVSVFRPENGSWYLQNSQTGFTGTQFGISTDKIVPADYDGDGKTDIAVYRDGVWYLQRSNLGFAGISFGASTDIPAPADFDGDGKTELAVYRPSNGTWYIYNLATNQVSGVQFGVNEDKPVPGDYDGDGKADIGVFRPSNGTWYLQRSSVGFAGIQFGTSEDKPVPARYDDGVTTDLGVFRPSTGTWYARRARSNVMILATAFGVGTDLPVPADYDGDGKADVAVFRAGTWYIQRSTQGFTGISFGAATDKPTPNAFVR